MTDEDDTSLLRTRSDVPPELLRALRALKSEGPSRSSLEQVAARLAQRLDGPPPLGPSGTWLLRGVGLRALAIRVGLAALAIGATAVWLRPSPREPGLDPAGAHVGIHSHDEPAAGALPDLRSRAEPPRASTSRPPAPLPASTHEPASASALAESLPHELAHDDDTGSATSRAGRDELAGRTRRPRGRPARGPVSPLAPATGQDTQKRTQVAVDDVHSLSSSSSALADTTARAVDAAVPRALELPVEPPSAHQLSEVELLLEARRLVTRDPRAAERLLAQHTQRFPDGVLAPEREVLAIEVLKALGQTAAAERRLRAFRARYPNSMHLRRLSTPPASSNR